MAHLVFLPSILFMGGVAVWLFFRRRRDRVLFNFASLDRKITEVMWEEQESMSDGEKKELLFLHHQASNIASKYDELRKAGFFNYDNLERFAADEDSDEEADFLLDVDRIRKLSRRDDDVIGPLAIQLMTNIAIALFAYTPFALFRIAWFTGKIVWKLGVWSISYLAIKWRDGFWHRLVLRRAL